MSVPAFETILESLKSDAAVGIITAAMLLIIGQFLKLWAENRTRRNLENIQFLKKAYELIEAAGSGRLINPKITRFQIETNLQRSFELIQLYGSKTQVKMVQELLAGMKSGNDVDMTALTTSLRDDLRKQLGLEKLDGKWFWFQPIPDDVTG